VTPEEMAIAAILARNPKRTQPIRHVVRPWKMRCRADYGTISNQRRIPLLGDGDWGVFGECGELLAIDLLVEAGAPLLELLGRALGRLDLWVERKFGRCLSGRMNKLEIQTLFHGNTKDQDQI
jgi:hypothetical protein